MEMDKRVVLTGLFVIAIIGIFLFTILNRAPTLTISSSSGEHVFSVEVADNLASQSKGLMFRKSLRESRGMLFVWKDEQTRSFWMKNTLIPLDMIFIDSNWTVVEINKNAVPCEETECSVYDSRIPAQYVLEINGGLGDGLGINVGDRASF